MPDVMPTLWQQRHREQCQALQRRWQAAGLPESLPLNLQRLVCDRCTAATREWIVATALDELCDDHLMHHWFETLENIDGADDMTHLLTWGFLHWGQFELPDLIDSIEDPDYQLCLDRTFHEASRLLEMSDLLTLQDRLARAVEPPDPAPAPPVVHEDRRQRATLEPFATAYFDQPSLLRELAPPVISWPDARPLPVVVGLSDKPTLFVLHMFSGRRRAYDCHHWIEQLAPILLPEFNVVSLSMDTAIDSELGNMLSGPSFEAACTMAHAGALGLGFAGPPCETWTAARHIQCDDVQHGPRPLRSCDQAWGLPGLSKRELAQVLVRTSCFTVFFLKL